MERSLRKFPNGDCPPKGSSPNLACFDRRLLVCLFGISDMYLLVVLIAIMYFFCFCSDWSGYHSGNYEYDHVIF